MGDLTQPDLSAQGHSEQREQQEGALAGAYRFSFLHATEKEFRRDLRDLFIFSRDVLGYSKLIPMHLGWFREALTEQFLVFNAPRGHFKSTVFTICYPLWRLKQNHNTRISLINETLPNAKGFLSEQKEHLRRNPKFREHYGRWDATAGSWNDYQIRIPRDDIRKEPSILVSSVGGSQVSNHPDLVVIDDPDSVRTVETVLQRRKTQKWLRSVLMGSLMPHTQVLIVQTRWHTDDTSGFIRRLEEKRHHQSKPRKWKVVSLAAEWNDSATSERHILFPEQCTPEYLDSLRDDMGEEDYRLQMLNDPEGCAGGEFQADWLEYYDVLPDKLDKYAGFDLAIGKNKVNSKFARAVIGRDAEGNLWLIEARKDRLSFPDQIDAVKRTWTVHRPHVLNIENNAYQDALPQMLEHDPETRDLPFNPVPSTGDKIRRIAGLAPLFKRGVFRVMRDNADFEDEYRSFPNGEMDLLDAIHIAWRGLRERPLEPNIHEISDEEIV